MEPLEIAMGGHNERLTFIVAPGMEWSMVLGLTWLKWWNLQVNWKEGTLIFQWGVTGPDDCREEEGEYLKKQLLQGRASRCRASLGNTET